MTKKIGAPVEEGLKVTLGVGTERTVALEHRAAVKESKPELEEEVKLEEDSETTKATGFAKIKEEKKDEKRFQEGEKCLARWDEDKVVYSMKTQSY